MNGVLLVDKPAGLSSHKVVALMKKATGVKVGHAGTLDPSATGLLIVCLGKATKISSYLMADNKVYETTAVLGVSTTTYDSEGEVVAECEAGHIRTEDLQRACSKFVGSIQQTPPVYSAIKVNGKRLYQLARQGLEIQPPVREVYIESMEVLSFENPLFSIRVACSKGTYIRSIIHDVGASLEVGATVREIRRTKSGNFSLQHAIPLEDLTKMPKEEIEKNLMPISTALGDQFKRVYLCEEDEARILRGIAPSKAKMEDTFSADDMILFSSKTSEQALALGQWGEQEKIQLKRVF